MSSESNILLKKSLDDLPYFDRASSDDSSEILTISSTPRTDPNETSSGSEVDDCADFEPISPAAAGSQSPVVFGSIVDLSAVPADSNNVNDHFNFASKPSLKSATTDGDDDWAHRHQEQHGKVPNLISLFNNSINISKATTFNAAYKYEYGLGRNPG